MSKELPKAIFTATFVKELAKEQWEQLLQSTKLHSANHEQAGKLMFVTRTAPNIETAEDEVEVLIMYPADSDGPTEFEAHGVVIKMHTLLNVAQMIAMQHGITPPQPSSPIIHPPVGKLQ